jgi:hypothetical protein
MTKCDYCGKVIRDLAGWVDSLAMPGDLCDDCAEAELDLERDREERREIERLDRRLRERPRLG